MLKIFVDLVGSVIGCYIVICLVCGVIFMGMLAFEWWMDKREKKKQDELMKDILEKEN